MNKQVVVIYVQANKESTRELTKFIAKYIDQINEYLTIKLVKVSKKNVDLVKAKGIDKTPTLIYNKKKYVSLEKIIKILTPPAENRDHYGYGNLSPEEMLQRYQDDVVLNEDSEDEVDELDPVARTQIIHQKMAALQKRRPEMEGVDDKHRLHGGQKLKRKAPVKTKFETDDEFVKASRVDNVVATPFKKYTDESDGDLILEDYFLEEAYRSGKKVSNKKINYKR